jgi:hypothetical protein
VDPSSEWTACRYGADDEALHDPAEQALYNESVYFNFVTGGPDGPLGGILRVGLRPVDGYAELSLNLPLGDGSTVFLYERQPLALDEFRVGSGAWRCGGMCAAVLVPTRTWSLRFVGDTPKRLSDPALFGRDPGAALRAATTCRVALDLQFDGRFPLHALSESGDIVAGGTAAFARNHYEQFGTITGAIELDGAASTVAGGAFRDHSWGPRDWQSAPDSDFTTVLGADGSGIVAFSARLDGDDHAHGVRWSEQGLERVSGFTVLSDYAGEETIGEALAVAFELPRRTLRYEATVRAFLPLRHRGVSGTVRIGQTLLEFSGPAGAAAGWSDFTRPV